MKQQTWPEAPLTVLTSVLELASSPTRFGRTHVCRPVMQAHAAAEEPENAVTSRVPVSLQASGGKGHG